MWTVFKRWYNGNAYRWELFDHVWREKLEFMEVQLNDAYMVQPNPKIMMKFQWTKPVILNCLKVVCSVIVLLGYESHIFGLCSQIYETDP